MEQLLVVLKLPIHQQEKFHQRAVPPVVSGEIGLLGQLVQEHVEAAVVRQEQDLA